MWVVPLTCEGRVTGESRTSSCQGRASHGPSRSSHGPCTGESQTLKTVLRAGHKTFIGETRILQGLLTGLILRVKVLVGSDECQRCATMQGRRPGLTSHRNVSFPNLCPCCVNSQSGCPSRRSSWCRYWVRGLRSPCCRAWERDSDIRILG